MANWNGGSKKEPDRVAHGRDRSMAFSRSFAIKGHRNEGVAGVGGGF